MAQTRIVGTRVRFATEVRNIAGALYDPPSGKLTCTISAPTANRKIYAKTAYTYPTDAAIVRDGTGLFHIDVYLQFEGRHVINFRNQDGGHESQDESVVVARGSEIT